MKPAPTIERVYYPWQKWECFKAGFFTPATSAAELAEWRQKYVALLSDLGWFERAMVRVASEWPHSIVHNLTNEGMNRVAWLGQASCCIEFGACAEQTRSAFNLLTLDKQAAANECAQKFLDGWLEAYRACLN